MKSDEYGQRTLTFCPKIVANRASVDVTVIALKSRREVGDYGEVPDWTGRMWNNLRLGPDIYKVFDGNYPETVRKAPPLLLKLLWPSMAQGPSMFLHNLSKSCIFDHI